jgi:crotonobetainyl-CoA:carnitine CoA-transferase CaiB-like acyl-CoA transferase
MLDSAVVWANIKSDSPAARGAYGIYRASDGLALSVAVIENKFWFALCDALEWGDWRTREDLGSYNGRATNAAEISARLTEALATRPRADWLSLFAAADVPAGPVNTATDVHNDPQVRERRLFVGEAGRLRPPLPERIGAPEVRSAPGRGEHSPRLLEEVGINAGECAALMSAGTVYSADPFPRTEDEIESDEVVA